MVTVGIPTATTCEDLNDYQRPFQLPGPADRSLKGEAPSRPPRRRHPVDDELALRPRWSVVQQTETGYRDRSDFAAGFCGYPVSH